MRPLAPSQSQRQGVKTRSIFSQDKIEATYPVASRIRYSQVQYSQVRSPLVVMAASCAATLGVHHARLRLYLQGTVDLEIARDNDQVAYF